MSWGFVFSPFLWFTLNSIMSLTWCANLSRMSMCGIRSLLPQKYHGTWACNVCQTPFILFEILLLFCFSCRFVIVVTLGLKVMPSPRFPGSCSYVNTLLVHFNCSPHAFVCGIESIITHWGWGLSQAWECCWTGQYPQRQVFWMLCLFQVPVWFEMYTYVNRPGHFYFCFLHCGYMELVHFVLLFLKGLITDLCKLLLLSLN